MLLPWMLLPCWCGAPFAEGGYRASHQVPSHARLPLAFNLPRSHLQAERILKGRNRQKGLNEVLDSGGRRCRADHPVAGNGRRGHSLEKSAKPTIRFLNHGGSLLFRLGECQHSLPPQGSNRSAPSIPFKACLRNMFERSGELRYYSALLVSQN